MKALLRSVLLVAAILILTQYVPELMPYRTAAIIVAIAYGLFGFIARSLLILLVVAAAGAAYFLNLF
jgi:hypothetical protein